MVTKAGESQENLSTDVDSALIELVEASSNSAGNSMMSLRACCKF
jgi:hypothetical protein